MSDVRPPSPPKDEVGVVTPPTIPNRPADRMPREFGRYRILERIGKGGMGAVYRAHDPQLDRVVALKVPFLRKEDADLRQRFYREARAAATLHHPTICPVYDVGEVGGLPYLTMAFIEGRSLAQLLEDRAPLTPTRVAQLLRKVAIGMHEAHAKGVIHRDLKPANILVRPNGEPVVTDFGLARRGDDESEGLTRQGEVIGTLEYMPPEQIDGDNAAVGPTADVYALGVVLFELLTGRRPFSGGTTTAKMAAILLKPPPRPSDLRPGIPPRLEEICLEAMARNPRERFQTMAEFAAALTEYLRSPQPATPAPVSAPATPAAASTPAPVATQRIIRPEPIAEDVKPKSAPRSVVKPRVVGGSKKRSKPKSKLPYVLGGAALALVCLTAIVVALILSSGGDSDRTRAVNSEPTSASPPVTAPTQPAVQPTARSSQARPKNQPSAAQTRPTTPERAEPQAVPLLRFRPSDLTLAVGEQRDVAVEVDRRGYRGPLTLRWDSPVGVRVSAAGPLTLKPGDPDPVLKVRLLSEPAAGEVKLRITGEVGQGSRAEPVAAQLTVGFTSSSCVRVIEVADRPDAAVEAMAMSPDATLALVGGGTGQRDANAVRVWDLLRGEPISPLTGHAGRITALAVSGNGKSALSLSADETVALWDLARSKRELQSPRQTMRVLNFAISHDAKWALVAYPGLIMKVDLEKFRAVGQPIKTAALTGTTRDDALRTVAVGAKGRALVGGLDGKLFLLELAEQARPKPLPGHREDVMCAAFGATGDLAATGGGSVPKGVAATGPENAVYLWDVNKDVLKWRAEGHNRPVVCVAISSDGQFVASGGADGEVRVWAAADGKPVASYPGHTGRVLALAFSSDGKTLWSGSADRSLRQWRLP